MSAHAFDPDTPKASPASTQPTAVVTTKDHDAPVAVAISAPIITPAPARNIQFWLTLAPLLSILITAVALLINAWISMSQGRRTAEATEATEWRQALNKLSEGSSGSTLATMLQMESFFTSKNATFRRDARSIAATLVSDSPNPYAFDIVVFRMVPDTTEQNQGDLLLVDQSLITQALQLFGTLYNRPATRDLLKDTEFQAFLVNPEDVITGPEQAVQRKQALDLAWKIDSVSSAIASAWKTQGIQPGKSELDLSGVVFLNQDLSRFDFSGLDLGQTAFLGKCAVPANLPPQAIVSCRTP